MEVKCAAHYKHSTTWKTTNATILALCTFKALEAGRLIEVMMCHLCFLPTSSRFNNVHSHEQQCSLSVHSHLKSLLDTLTKIHGSYAWPVFKVLFFIYWSFQITLTITIENMTFPLIYQKRTFISVVLISTETLSLLLSH